MRADDVQAVIERATGEVGIQTFAHLDDIALPLACGTGGDGTANGFRLAIFGDDSEAIARLTTLAAGEVDVYRIPFVEPRITSIWAKRPSDIIGIGLQVGPVGSGWVGTGGIVVRAEDDPGVLLHLTNEHVTGEGAPRGRLMHQGGRTYGAVWKVGGLRFDGSQAWDCGSVSIDAARRVNAVYEQGLDNNLAGIRRMGPDDVGRRFTNTGQTRGTMFGSCIAVGIRDLLVGYDGGTGRFHDQAAFVGEDGKPFSVGGHSGSTIACMEDGHACALLFAGGPDEQGRDVTFAAADLPGAIRAAGGVPELVSA